MNEELTENHSQEEAPEEVFLQETLLNTLLAKPYFIYAFSVLILAILASLLYAVIFIWFPSNPNDTPRENILLTSTTSTSDTTKPSSVATPENILLLTSLKLLQKRSIPSECTFSHKTSTGENYFGTAYVRPQNEIRVNLISDKQSIHIIKLDAWGWYWTSGFTPATAARFTDSLGVIDDAVISLEQTLSFSCKNWTDSDSTFTPPSSKYFGNLPGQGLAK